MSQLYCLLGLPGSGKGSIANAIVKSSKRRLTVVSSGDIARSLATKDEKLSASVLFPREEEIRGEIRKSVRRAFANGAEAVILDGCPRFLEQLQWVEMEFLDKDPIYVKIHGPSNDALVERIVNRARDEFDTAEQAIERISKHSRYISDMERYIFSLNLEYFTVNNDNLEDAVAQYKRVVPSPRL